MDTTSGKNLQRGSAIYRPQLITIEDLAAFKDDLLQEIKKLLSNKLRRDREEIPEVIRGKGDAWDINRHVAKSESQWNTTL